MNTNNKKTIKKILAILVAIVVFAFPISTAFASDNTSTSTTEPYYCDEGGSHHRREVGQIGWHSTSDEAFTATMEYISANGGSGNYTMSRCSCGKYTAYITISEDTSHTHSWDNGVVTKEATCTEKGIITYTCSGCDEIRTEDIAEINHNYVPLVVSPTCTEEGYTIHTCETCKGYYIDSKTDATGHDYQYVANNDGTHNKVCTACGDAVVENCNKVAEGDHYICSDCSARYEDTTKPTEPSTELPTEPTTDTVTKPTTTEPSTELPSKPTTDTVTKPNEAVTGEDNIEVSDEAKTENKAVTEGDNGTTANEDKDAEQKSPSTGAELIDTGDNTSMNILFLGAGLVMAVAVAVVLTKIRKEESSSL